MLRSSIQIHMILWLALSLVPLACDKGDGGGDPAPADTTADTIAPQNSTEDATEDLVAPEDTLPPPEDTTEDTPPPPDTLEDIPCDFIPETQDTNPDIPTDPDCIPEGGSGAVIPNELPCCEGLTSIGCDAPDQFTGECLPCDGGFFCTTCGNGVCDEPENVCNCPADCLYQDCDIPPLYPLLTVEDILADPVPYDGSPVAFEGHVMLGGMICGAVECPPEDPCCQPCGVGYEVFSAGGTIGIVGGGIPQVGCVGNNCTVMDNCTPFPTTPADYLLWGTLEAAWGPTLYLDGWCPAQ